DPRRPARRPDGRVARGTLRPLPQVRRPGPPAHTVTDRGDEMTEPATSGGSPDQDFVRVVWEEARDLIKRLEGTTVQRFSVEAGQTVAIVEAMKLMNQVTAEQAGKVAEIVAKDGDWVEFEQVLMYLDPLAG